MADVILSDGREITFDLMKVTWKEWRGIWDSNEAAEDTDATIARCAGLTVEEFLNLPQPDARSLLFALNRKGTQPLSVPNSPRAST